MPIRVLVVDDHPAFRAALVSALSYVEAVDVIGEAAGGVAACASAAELVPDAIVMDVSMADLSGIDAMQHIHRNLPSLPVIFLTGRGDEGVRREAMAAGGAGFVMKGAPLIQIVDAILEATGGERQPAGLVGGPPLGGPDPARELDQELLGELGVLVEQRVEVP